MKEALYNLTNSKFQRLSYIYERLKQSSDGLSISELAKELGVSTKTIQRDFHHHLTSLNLIKVGRRFKLDISSPPEQENPIPAILATFSSSLQTHFAPLDDVAGGGGVSIIRNLSILT